MRAASDASRGRGACVRLAAIRLGINQGRTEALNNKVRLIVRRAYGFHTAEAALALVMLTCGPITLRLPHQLQAVGSP